LPAIVQLLLCFPLLEGPSWGNGKVDCVGGWGFPRLFGAASWWKDFNGNCQWGENKELN